MKLNVWGKKYKGFSIKSDFRVHEKIEDILKAYSLNNLKILDIATGNGALSARLKDNFIEAQIDINDYENESIYKDFNKKYSIDLNSDFNNKFKKYNVILAVEIIEHLENPWHFIKNIYDILEKDGLLVISTPNTDSFLDRLHFFIYGHAFYFGEPGYDNSGGHITQIPDWLFKKIAMKYKLNIIKENFVDTSPHFGKKKIILSIIFYPIYRLFSHFINNRSINIYILKKEGIE